MAVTGIILFGFVVGHLLGNLQSLRGTREDSITTPRPEGSCLRSLGHANPAADFGHPAHLVVVPAVACCTAKRGPIQYVKKANLNSTYASRTMYWSGPIVLAFVIFHLLQFTFGAVHPGATFAEDNVYSNVVSGFQFWPVSFFYIIAMVMLCYHLYHGLWSMFQSLGFSHPVYTPWLRGFAKLVRHSDC